MTPRGTAGAKKAPAARGRAASKSLSKGAALRDISDFKRALDLIVVGGGPAGLMAGLLFARAGCTVQVLEKHTDFFHDFRGDTVHPSTMEILDQLGMLQRFLERPHHKLHKAQFRLAGRVWTIGDLSRLRVVAPYAAIMPQWDFLDFVRTEASVFPGFRLAMKSAVESYLEENGHVVGVRLADGRELRARLVIAADGRHSLVRRILPLEKVAVPIDVFWFNVPHTVSGGEALLGSIERERILIMIDRGDHWQCALIISKGSAEELKAGGIEPIRRAIHTTAPHLDLSNLKKVDDLALLTVTIDRLTGWSKPGLLAIGDAAHAMSPVGGIGINLAIQDAVATANYLAGPLARGESVDGLLHKIQQRRLFPTRLVQFMQRLGQDRVFAPVLRPGEPITKAPWLVRFIDRHPVLQDITAHFVGLGVRRERVRSPNAYA
jgi:2-polyprenyl-6-methoxyphenol hydroxylase-like FAD-dependent oxidoreductase